MVAMEQSTGKSESERLEAFIGEWSTEATFEGAPPGDSGARCAFEWMPGERFVVQRWQVPHPAAPDGLAIIGFHPERGSYLQHYFDSRGVARVYEMSLGDGEWKLWRDTEDFSELKFLQRYTGRFSDEGETIEGAWEICHDGETWEHDFDLIYRKLS